MRHIPHLAGQKENWALQAGGYSVFTERKQRYWDRRKPSVTHITACLCYAEIREKRTMPKHTTCSRVKQQETLAPEQENNMRTLSWRWSKTPSKGNHENIHYEVKWVVPKACSQGETGNTSHHVDPPPCPSNWCQLGTHLTALAAQTQGHITELQSRNKLSEHWPSENHLTWRRSGKNLKRKILNNENKNRFYTFFSSLLSGSVYMILKLDSNLPFIWLIPYKRMFQKLLCGGSLHVILHQASFYKTKKFLWPVRESEKYHQISTTKSKFQNISNL